MNSTKIQFINHASVLISYNNIGLLSDPWYDHTVFHKGWRLLYETQLEDVLNVLDSTSHIFISHEHPDHFNTSFFLNKEIKNKILKKKYKSFISKKLRWKGKKFFI